MKHAIANHEIRLVSQSLLTLADRFGTALHGGRYFSPDQLAGLIKELATLTAHAKALENEVSALRWNEAGRRDRDDLTVGRLRRALADPSGKVALLPIVARRPGMAAEMSLYDNDACTNQEDGA